MIVAIDPGREKCGMAAMERDGTCTWHRVVPRTDFLAEVERVIQVQAVEKWVVGSGTTSAEVVASLSSRFGADNVVVVDERDSTLEARFVYFEEHPPRWIWRWLPKGLLYPPCAIDDYAAIVLGRRFLGRGERSR